MMNNDIILFIKEICENTGAQISLFDNSGRYIYGEKINVEQFLGVTGVVQDKNLDRTFFPLVFGGKKYIVSILGSKKSVANYAYFISELSDKYQNKTYNYTKEDFLKALVFGEVNLFQKNKYLKKFGVVDKPCCVILLVSKPNISGDILNLLSNYSTEGNDFAIQIGDSQVAFIKFSDDVTSEYKSFNEYSNTLYELIYEELRESVNILVGGTVNSVADLNVSFLQALSAERMCKIAGKLYGVHSFKEFIFIKMLEDLPKYKLNEYLEILQDPTSREIFLDSEMILTAETFMDNSLNVSETSRKLYLHRNTLNYRLDKIEKLTGLDIRKFSDAVTFRLVTVISKLIK